MKWNWHIILTIFFSLLILAVFTISIFSSLNDTTTILEYYCEDSGGEWNFYECYNVGIGLGNNGGDSSCNYPGKYKNGYWCDYPDRTSKSENEIEYELNSTTTLI